MTISVTLNGDDREVAPDRTLDELVREEVGEDSEHVAVAVDDDVVPRSEWKDTSLEEGQTVEVIRPIKGGETTLESFENDDPLVIGDRELTSRIIVGSGGHTNLRKLEDSIRASGTEMVTVGLRRVNVEDDQPGGLMEVLSACDVDILPNTAGCYTADDAVTTARLGREALGTDWVKLEVIGDDETLYPDVEELLEAARRLVDDGFVVLPYTNDDPVTAQKLVSAGCPVVMPLASPIGSGRGIANPDNLQIIREKIDVPVIIDAGIGSARDAVRAMELGADAILTSSAIAKAEDPPRMARSLRYAVMAGRLSYTAGRIPEKLYAEASTVMEGRIRE